MSVELDSIIFGISRIDHLRERPVMQCLLLHVSTCNIPLSRFRNLGFVNWYSEMRLPPPISVTYSENYSKDSNPSPSSAKISPAVLFIIIILAVFFFVSGLLHLLVRILARHKSSSSISESDRYPEMPERDSYQRQLQQLFYLHDSGLDQAFIDELPVFIYKEIVGLKEHFDCAVCLCEFSEKDKLRLLPRCSHAFHINCIDTWLLSNSTCPLCRGSLISHDLTVENPLYFFDDSGEGDDGFGRLSSERPGSGEITSERWVFAVRLGKLRRGLGVEAEGASSSCGLDARRCYSMGSLQYVVSNSELQVSVCSRRIGDGCSSIDGHGEGKRIGLGSKAESFSVSKVWLWPKKGKLVNDSLCTVASSSASSSVHVERNRVL